MPKLLRPGERVDFVQTRAPRDMWRGIRGLAVSHASDGTVRRLCTVFMVEYLRQRPWEAHYWAWRTPQSEFSAGAATGFCQVNLPLSNIDEAGELIPSTQYLEKIAALEMFEHMQLMQALADKDFSRLVYAAAAGQGVSGASFAFTFLHWLVSACPPSLVANYSRLQLAA
jgi:hypothetical protein